jgi:hypothetical protein
MVSVALTERCYRRDQNAAFSRFANAHRLSKLRGLVPGQCLRDWNRGALRCRSVWHQAALSEAPQVGVVGEPTSEAAVAAFKSELGAVLRSPAIPEPPPVAETAAAPAVSENGDPAGPSLDQLIGTPAAAEVSQADEASPPTAAATLNEAAIPGEPSPPTAPADDTSEPPGGAGNVEAIAARRRRSRGSARCRIPVRSARMAAAILMLACMIAALIAWRGTIVRHAPQMASLYAAIGIPVNVRGLTFTEVKVSRDIHDGVAVLMVEGIIASTASKPVEVPRLRFAMRNEAGGEVYAWTGETLPFRSRLASPPGEDRDVTVRFFNRLDATAGLR